MTMSLNNGSPSGVIWDPYFNNLQGVLLASAVRAAPGAVALQSNVNHTKLKLWLNVSAVPGAPGVGGLKLAIMEYEPVSGAGVQMNAQDTLITAVGLYVYTLHPFEPSVAVIAGPAVPLRQHTQDWLPRVWSALVSHADGQNYTYSLAYSLGL